MPLARSSCSRPRRLRTFRPGWRARETYIVHGPDEFEEVFELEEAEKAFELYSRARFKRPRVDAPGFS